MNRECREIFNGLVSNAFDFLFHSIEEFEKNTKYSVIHFCIAVENILKAELIWHDWTLVFDKLKNANFDDFKNGNFKSASTKIIIDRLRSNAKIIITNDAVNSFKCISMRRNKVVHFSTKESSIQKDDILAEQARAWYHLDKLLRTWHHHFSKFIEEKRIIRIQMSEQNKYLSTRYSMILPSIEELETGKFKLTTCPACHYRSIAVPIKNKMNTKLRCKVCDNEYKFSDLKINNI